MSTAAHFNQLRTRPSPLYAITPSGWPAQRLLGAVDQLLTVPLAMLQYRDKPRPDVALAKALQQRCHAAQVPLLINDDVDLAAEIGAAGVHLGRDDTSLVAARRRLGPEALIGVSCYNDLNRARALADEGADYLAFGAVFASPTKPLAPLCPLSHFAAARAWGLPLVAIGGIDADNAPQVLAAGADMVAVISHLFEAEDIAAQARRLALHSAL